MRSEAVKKTVLWTVFRPTVGALQRGDVISRSEMESYRARQRTTQPRTAGLFSFQSPPTRIRTDEVGGR